MLFLQVKSGEYLTIGEDIAIQVFQASGSKIRVAVKAPKDVTVLRGQVWERNGEDRPEGLIGPRPPAFAAPPQRRKETSPSVSPG